MQTMLLTALSIAIFAPSVTTTSTDAAARQAFDKMKSLVGKWEGTMADGKDKMPASVEYRLTGSNSALVETLGPGSPYEMVSVYHMDNGSLKMTHYCGSGNQPSMKLKPGASANTLFFDFVSGSNMKLTDMHMHSVKFTFDGPDHLIAIWQSYSGGKPGEKAAFDFHRVK